MRFLVTGHTGFKGAWLTFLLQGAGHSVAGLALDPVPASLFERLHLAPDLLVDARTDVRDPVEVLAVVSDVQPDVVVHLAAQPLVRASFANPRGTIDTNVLGTLQSWRLSLLCLQFAQH